MIVPAAPGFKPYSDYLGSHLEVLEIATGQREILHSEPGSIQSFDGKMLALSNYTGQPRRYFNSLRTGTMQIWRMRPDGSSRAPIQHIEILEE